LFPKPCAKLNINHAMQLSLLKDIRNISGIRKVVIASGIRHDMILADQESGNRYLKDVTRHHVSGQMKIAPEHSESHVLQKMGKPGAETVLKFKKMFDQQTKREGLNQFLTYYLIAAHPGCTEKDMAALKSFAMQKLGILPEQVQVFTPTPSTYSTLMYWIGIDPFTGEPCFVEKTIRGKERQKNIIAGRGDKKRTVKRKQNSKQKGRK
jgi:uncharacterized radical SAM protein YgiQ